MTLMNVTLTISMRDILALLRQTRSVLKNKNFYLGGYTTESKVREWRIFHFKYVTTCKNLKYWKSIQGHLNSSPTNMIWETWVTSFRFSFFYFMKDFWIAEVLNEMYIIPFDFNKTLIDIFIVWNNKSSVKASEKYLNDASEQKKSSNNF